MATAEQLKALLRSYADGDDARFLAIAMQMAAQAARQGHGKLAQELRSLVDSAKSKRSVPPRPVGPTPIAQPRGELAGLLSVLYPKTRLSDMVLDSGVRDRLERVIHEQRQQQRLRSHGLSARHRLLLIGPPGSGKTMTAAALANELGIPLFTIQLDGLITKFMGETAAKLRLVFDALRTTRGVYLFDEFDAIGGNRAVTNDVGEIRRVLNSFLQFLEQDDSNSLIVAATNHAQVLDKALFRRFDDVIEYGFPKPELALKAIRSKLGTFGTKKIASQSVVAATDGLSYAEITRACENAVKDAILRDESFVSPEALVRALEERRASERP